MDTIAVAVSAERAKHDLRPCKSITALRRDPSNGQVQLCGTKLVVFIWSILPFGVNKVCCCTRFPEPCLDFLPTVSSLISAQRGACAAGTYVLIRHCFWMRGSKKENCGRARRNHKVEGSTSTAGVFPRNHASTPNQWFLGLEVSGEFPKKDREDIPPHCAVWVRAWNTGNGRGIVTVSDK